MWVVDGRSGRSGGGLRIGRGFWYLVWVANSPVLRARRSEWGGSLGFFGSFARFQGAGNQLGQGGLECEKARAFEEGGASSSQCPAEVQSLVSCIRVGMFLRGQVTMHGQKLELGRPFCIDLALLKYTAQGACSPSNGTCLASPTSAPSIGWMLLFEPPSLASSLVLPSLDPSL